MTRPNAKRLFDALDATWPAARYIQEGPWLLREGLGGGQRVSAATAISSVLETDIAQAETGMANLGQRPLFMIRPDDAELDRCLEARGYEVVDPVVLYLSPTAELAKDLPPATAIPCWPPLAIQREIWEAAGIGSSRISVMERSDTVRTTFLARAGDTPAGVAYTGISADIAMLHALEVVPDQRRSGMGAAIIHSAVNWAIPRGASWLALAVTKANVPANSLYERLAMTPATEYHYRRAPERRE